MVCVAEGVWALGASAALLLLGQGWASAPSGADSAAGCPRRPPQACEFQLWAPCSELWRGPRAGQPSWGQARKRPQLETERAVALRLWPAGRPADTPFEFSQVKAAAAVLRPQGPGTRWRRLDTLASGSPQPVSALCPCVRLCGGGQGLPAPADCP